MIIAFCDIHNKLRNNRIWGEQVVYLHSVLIVLIGTYLVITNETF